MLDRDPRQAPRFPAGSSAQRFPVVVVAQRSHRVAISPWERRPARRGLVFRFDGDDASGDIVVMTGAEFAVLATAQDEAAQRRDRERRESRPTGDQVTRLDGCTIAWHRENEVDVDGYLISIQDDTSTPCSRSRSTGTRACTRRGPTCICCGCAPLSRERTRTATPSTSSSPDNYATEAAFFASPAGRH